MEGLQIAQVPDSTSVLHHDASRVEPPDDDDGDEHQFPRDAEEDATDEDDRSERDEADEEFSERGGEQSERLERE